MHLPSTTALVLGLLLGLTLAARAASAPAGPQDPATLEQLLEQSRPGPEHARLERLAGDWKVARIPAGSERPSETGSARARSLIGGRFLDVEVTLGEAELRYTLGFDRRHGEYSLILIDDAGTYAVSARGPEVDGRIRMTGVDDDPYMAGLGLEKKFAFDLELSDAQRFALVLHFVDTRPDPEVVHPAYTVRFTRG